MRKNKSMIAFALLLALNTMAIGATQLNGPATPEPWGRVQLNGPGTPEPW